MMKRYILMCILWAYGSYGVLADSNPPTVPQIILDIDSLEDAETTSINLYDHFEDDVDADADLVYAVDNNSNAALFTSITIASGQLSLVYAPDAFGQSTLTISATDSDNQTSVTSFEVNLTPVNDAPEFIASTIPSILEDADIQEIQNWATFNAGPPNEQSGQILTSYQVSEISDPSLFQSPPSIDLNGSLSFTPAKNAFGSSTFEVTAFDNGGTANGGVDSSATQTFTIEIIGVNDPPILSVGNITPALEDAAPQVIANWATFDAGADNEDEQIPTYTIRNISNPEIFDNEPTVDISGTLTYSLANNAFGSSTMEIFVTDDGGVTNGGQNRSETLSFTIEVLNINDAPDFTANPPASVLEDTGNKSYPGWATFSPGANENTQTANYVVSNVENPDLFSINPSINSSGTLTFTTANDANGSSTFTMYVQDNGGTENGGVNQSAEKTFTIEIIPVNDAPNFNATNPAAVSEDFGLVNIDTWASFNPGAENESGQEASFSILNITNPSLFAQLPEVDNTGRLTFTTAANKADNSNFEVQVTDNGGTANGGINKSIVKTFTITVNPVNDPPQFTSSPVVAINEDQPYTYNITYTDLETAAEDLIITATVLPEWLSLNENAGSATLSGTPTNEHVGSHTVTLTISDGDLQTDQSFNVTVQNTNDAPLFTSTPATKAIRDQPYFYPIRTSDQDPADVVNLTALQIPEWLTYISTGQGTAELSGTPSLSQANKNHQVRLRATDIAGASTLQQFNIEVVVVNSQPTITSSPVTEASDGNNYSYTITATDPDPSDQLIFTAPSLPDWLTLMDNGNKTALLSGIPDNQDIGDTQVTITVTDAVGASNTQVFTIKVSNVNDPPQFTSVAKTVATEDVEYQYNIATSDPDVNDTRTLSAPELPSWLSLTTSSGNGTLKGTPDDPDVGSHPVRLVVTDAAGTQAVQEFSIEVSNINDEPQFTSSPLLSAIINQSYIYNISVADEDINDNLTITTIQKPTWLNFQVTGSNSATLSGTPIADDAGFHDVVLRVTDEAGVQKLQEYEIKVNTAPIISDVTISTLEDQPIDITPDIFSAAFADADGDDISAIKILTLPQSGNLLFASAPVAADQEIDANTINQLRYEPVANQHGSVSFEYNAFDGYNYANSKAKVSIEILPVNDEPRLSLLTEELSYRPLIDESVLLAENVVIEDVDSDSIIGMQIFFAARVFQSGQDLLAVETTANISSNYNEETGILNVSGKDNLENYTQVLRSLTYEYRGTEIPNYEARAINYILDDGEDVSNLQQQSIEMIQLDKLTIPSGFTPNNDGVNDLWQIENIELYPNCQVKVFTREGKEIYGSVGYSTPWDGTYAGSNLPAGPYFYVIVLNELQQQSGGVTIIK